METSEKIEAILNAANEVIGDTEGPRTPAQARLTLALYAYDPVRFALGTKESCPCGEQEDCDECLTTEETVAWVNKLAQGDSPSPTQAEG